MYDVFERRSLHIGVHVFGYGLKKDQVRNNAILHMTRSHGAEKPDLNCADLGQGRQEVPLYGGQGPVGLLHGPHTTATEGAMHWCFHCLSFVSSAEGLTLHKDCEEAVKTVPNRRQ